jgi:hypothetical protein
MSASFYLKDSFKSDGTPEAVYIDRTDGFVTPRIIIDVPHDVSPRDAITIAKAILDVVFETVSRPSVTAGPQTKYMCGIFTGNPPFRVACTLPEGHTGPHVS